MRNRKPDPVAERIAGVIARHTLSTVAQRTGTPLANVHRYARGAKVPADFCARLVREFNVNPAWLLNGEGAADLADVHAAAGNMAGNLLELVEAMNAVMHMRLGALAGKRQLKVLRELDDALRRYEDLRKRLNEHALPIFRQVADELRKALGKLDVARARELFKPLDQVVRLCQDEEAERTHLALKSHFAVLTRDFGGALAMQQRLFRHPVATGGINSEQWCDESTRLLITLDNAGREADALRVGEAALLLAAPAIHGTPSHAMLQVMTGDAMLQQGRLHEGLALVQQGAGKLKDEGRARAARHKIMMGLVYGGILTPMQAFEWGDHYDVKAFDLLNVAILKEDPALLERALAYRDDPRVERAEVYRPYDYVTDHARALLHALAGAKAPYESAWKALRAKWLRPDNSMDLHIYRTQALRVLGKDARPEHTAAVKAMAEAARRVWMLQRLLHYRNAAAIPDAPDHTHARQELERYASSGYQLLK